VAILSHDARGAVAAKPNKLGPQQIQQGSLREVRMVLP
jgi:hypothetical protein